jgi:hypothetical protein
MQMIREQTGHQLDVWLGEAEASRLPEFQSFAKGIHHDKAAVLAGLTLPWSQGPSVRHVNRLQHPETKHVWSCQAPTARERACFMWMGQRSFLMQTSAL